MQSTQTVVVRRTYPWTEMVMGETIKYRLMTSEDSLGILRLARSLPEEDLAFLRIDITQPKIVEEWIGNLERGRVVTVLAVTNGQIVAYGSLYHDETKWTSHMCEIRILVTPDYRKHGIGRKLAAELFHIANEMNLERIICQIPAAQPRVRRMFESLGFQAEAILNDWVMCRNGETHDLMVMSQRTDHFGEG